MISWEKLIHDYAFIESECKLVITHLTPQCEPPTRNTDLSSYSNSPPFRALYLDDCDSFLFFQLFPIQSILHAATR